MQENFINTVVLNSQATNDMIPIVRAPLDAIGGGITLNSIDVLQFPIAEDQTSSTALTLLFLIYSALGTPALSGTVGAALGGTAAPLLKGVPQSVTITSAFLDAGQWLMAKYTETGTTNPTNCAIVVNYSMGK
jgi:hypothetical protein